MEHYQVILAYDGSHFKGFQRQTKVRSVQGVVEDVLRHFGWRGKSILAAGRTDTGAHATGQVIAFELEWDHNPQDLRQAMNKYLPGDVVAVEVRQVRHSFHPRYDASWRRYYYRIYCQPVRQPLLDPYAWRVWPAADADILQASAHELVGTHDFGAFGNPPTRGGSTIRCVLESGWQEQAPYLTYQIKAQAFLYHMVRRLVFIQVSIAQRKIAIVDMLNALEASTSSRGIDGSEFPTRKRQVHGLAPARGLVLAEVHYPPEAYIMDEDTDVLENLAAE